MAVITIGRLSEEVLRVISGGNIPLASKVTLNEIKIALGQAINAELKVDYFQTSLQLGEVIPNGSMIGLYEDIQVVSWNGKSKASLPVKPIKLPRNMGVWAIYKKINDNSDYELDNEFIPLQMGQGGLLKSQPLIDDLLGQIGYEVFGGDVIFTKDIKSMWPNISLAMRLVIMDISQYGDYDILPITPEIEMKVKMDVIKLYMGEPIADKLVDPSVKESKGVPVSQQKQ